MAPFMLHLDSLARMQDSACNIYVQTYIYIYIYIYVCVCVARKADIQHNADPQGFARGSCFIEIANAPGVSRSQGNKTRR